ncbi:MAG: response regulator [Acidobacteriota bacterium]
MSSKAVRSLLIVDDDPGDALIAKHYLEKSGRYEHVLTASDGREALQLWENHETSRQEHGGAFPPLIVLLDINMPRMNGFEFLEALAELPQPEVTASFVVMVTSSEHGPDVERASIFPRVKDYLVKPFTLQHAIDLADRFGS